ncbi:MAG: EthD family reductase [Candidatus Promineifilaceae bacterium]
MFKFVTLYRQVEEPEAVDNFFASAHLPAAERLPGLLKREVGRVMGKPGGASRFYLMVELYFADQAAFQSAMRSPAGQELAAALAEWEVAGLITWFYADAFEE